MVKLVNRAKMTTPTIGTGTLTLGQPVDAFQSFAAAGVTTGDTVRYVIEDGSAWEIGLGTYTAAGPSLTRSPSDSSAAGAPIALSGGAVIFIAATTADIVQPGDNITTLFNDAGYTANAGTVTSVAAAAGTGISISGSPVTSAGTLTITNTAPHQATNLGITGTGNTRTITSSTGTNVTVPVVSTTTAGLMAIGDKAKLDAIEAGAQANTVISVAGRAGAVILAKTDVELGNVDNTSDATKPVSTATQTALNSKVDKLSGKGLSTEDYTTAEQTKLAGMQAGAQVNAPTNLSVTAGTTDGPTVNSSTGTNATLPSASGIASGVITTGEQTFAGTKTFSSTLLGSVSGNAGTASTLQTARTINGTSFNGSANITTASWGISRTLTIGASGKPMNGTSNVSWSLAEIGAASASHTHTLASLTDTGIASPAIGDILYYNSASFVNVSPDTAGLVAKSGNQTIAGTKTFSSPIVGSVSGNADTATKLAATRTIALTGDITGSASFDGSSNITIDAAVVNGGGGGGFVGGQSFVVISSQNYGALSPPDANTLFVIVANVPTSQGTVFVTMTTAEYGALASVDDNILYILKD